MVGSQHQPATEEEGEVEDPGTDKEPHHAGYGQPQRQQEHVVLVEVAEEAKDATPLGKHCQSHYDAGNVYHVHGVCVRLRG